MNIIKLIFLKLDLKFMIIKVMDLLKKNLRKNQKLK